MRSLEEGDVYVSRLWLQWIYSRWSVPVVTLLKMIASAVLPPRAIHIRSNSWSLVNKYWSRGRIWANPRAALVRGAMDTWETHNVIYLWFQQNSWKWTERNWRWSLASFFQMTILGLFSRPFYVSIHVVLLFSYFICVFKFLHWLGQQYKETFVLMLRLLTAHLATNNNLHVNWVLNGWCPGQSGFDT